MGVSLRFVSGDVFIEATFPWSTWPMVPRTWLDAFPCPATCRLTNVDVRLRALKHCGVRPACIDITDGSLNTQRLLERVHPLLLSKRRPAGS